MDQKPNRPKNAGQKLALSAVIGVCIGALLFLAVHTFGKDSSEQVTASVDADGTVLNSEANEDNKDGFWDRLFDKKDKKEKKSGKKPDPDEGENAAAQLNVTRPSLIATVNVEETVLDSITPVVELYEPGKGLSNVANLDQFYLPDEALRKLEDQNFVVTDQSYDEFYECYENNRYMLTPSFVTVDSMMHTYHLYFAYLLRTTEREYLSELLRTLSVDMQKETEKQLEILTEPEWVEACERNYAFFSIGAALSGEDLPDSGPQSDTIREELEKIERASDITICPMNGKNLDYTQFIPRGYYEGDPELEAYFKAMMWYGQIGFLQSEETLDRSAVLMTLALTGDTLETWEKIYTVTSFFAGAADDLGYYEYRAAIDSVYGEGAGIRDLEGNASGWEDFRELTASMEPPQINSIPLKRELTDEDDILEENKGYRFMGQRFTIDAAIFTQLLPNQIGKNAQGEIRELPDTLDVAAASGSAEAYSILDAQGETDYDQYPEQMEALQTAYEEAGGALWSASLYANWLYTLKPLLEVKPDGYPAFMQSDAWLRKDLETFAGSYTELKHDTVLYAKQVMVEMGGGMLPEYDDRGYVEPEVDVWSRFAALSEKTAEGLDSYGLLGDEDAENLALLTELADSLLTISEKELQNETLTDEEYELIRSFGGQLEHFWETVVSKDATSEQLQYGISGRDFPAALVTDIASNSKGICLELGVGNPTTMYVVAPVDGTLKICEGACYDYYRFVQPSSERLTDTQWREMMGFEMNAAGNYSRDKIEKPEWTQSYRIKYGY